MNGSLTWIIIPVPRAFAEGRVAAVHESRKWHETDQTGGSDDIRLRGQNRRHGCSR
jgi:hypothetical protein